MLLPRGRDTLDWMKEVDFVPVFLPCDVQLAFLRVTFLHTQYNFYVL